MRMLKQKDILAHFLSTNLKFINFQLREEFSNFLLVNLIQPEKLYQHLNKQVDQKIITKVQLFFENENKNNLSNHNNSTNLDNANFSFLNQDDSLSQQFRHKSIF
ncbi:hypothetical protein ABPG72_001781 [Tetrahymena utriculariae]